MFRDLYARIRFSFTNAAAAEQHLFERCNEVQIIEDFVSRRTPVRQSQRMREQRLARPSGITEPHRHTSQKGNQRSFNSILKQHREIKLSALPLANLRNH